MDNKNYVSARSKADRSLRRYTPRLNESEPVENFWDHIVEVWHLLRPSWWPILITFALCFLVMNVEQIRDMLAAMPMDFNHGIIHEGEAGISGRFWTSFIACSIYSFIAWAFIRALLSIRFPYTPCPYDPPDWHVVIRVFLSRFLGVSLPLSCALAYFSLGMSREGLAYCILAIVMFFVFYLSRKQIHEWIDDQLEIEETQDLGSDGRKSAQNKNIVQENASEDSHAELEKEKLSAFNRNNEGIDDGGAPQAVSKSTADVNTDHATLSSKIGKIFNFIGDRVNRAWLEFSESELFDEAMPENFAPQMRWLLSAIMVFHLTLAILILVSPVEFPQAIGALAIIFLGAAGWLSFGVLLFSYFPRYTRLPSAFILYFVWLAFASQFNENHNIRRLPIDQTQTTIPINVNNYLEDWLTQRADYLPRSPGDKEFPILMIAAEGGGARAAYWTGTVLAEIQEAKPASGLAPQDHILLVSGVSGGALGTASYGAALAEGNNDNPRIYNSIRGFLKLDFLSPTTGGALYHDFFSDILPFPLEFADRANWIERSWIHGWRSVEPESNTFGEDFRALWDTKKGRKGLGKLGAVPLLVYNTTSARSGSTWTVSPVKFSETAGCNSRDFVDLLAAEQKGISLATAAHLSARFTGISPAGRIDLAGYDDCKENSFDRFVDGAYFENSGADIAANMMRRFRSKVETFCQEGLRCDPALMPIIPVAIVAETAPSSNPPSISHETGSVIMTVANTRSARGQDSLNRFEEVVGMPLKKIELALGWQQAEEKAHCSILQSNDAKNKDASKQNNTFRRVPLGWTLSHAAVDHMCRERLRDTVLDDITSQLEGRNVSNPQ